MSTKCLAVAGCMLLGPSPCTLAQGDPGIVDESWARHVPSLDTTSDFAPTEDFTPLIAVDPAGEFFIACSSRIPGRTDDDVLTIKYAPFGLRDWTARFEGPGSTDDVPVGLGVDRAGNVIVALNSSGMSGSATAAAIVKYDDTGNELWISEFGTPADSAPTLLAMTLDDAGNVFAAGICMQHDSTFSETAKYSASGSLLWIDRQHAAGYSQLSLRIGAGGDCLVAGFRYTDTTSATQQWRPIVRYSTSGQKEWEVEIPPAQFFPDPILATDRSGNIWVTGPFRDSTGDSFMTAKLQSNGDTMWTRKLGDPSHVFSYQPTFINSDSNGNVYVGGYSISGSDLYVVILKYDPSGSRQWVKSFRGPGLRIFPFGMSVDGAGDSFISATVAITDTTAAVGTFAYGPTGLFQWSHLYVVPVRAEAETSAVAVGGSHVYVAADVLRTSESHKIAALEYDVSGTEVWADVPYDTVARRPAGLVSDGMQNVFVTGSTEGGSTAEDYLTVKYGPDGTPLWASRYNGPADSVDEPAAIALDMEGGVYVTGRSKGLGTGSDYATLRYDSQGTRQWLARYDGMDSREDSPAALAVDSLGYVIVSGTSERSDGGSSILTIKYTPAGNLQWIAYSAPIPGGRDRAAALSVDRSGNVYVSGSSDSAGTFDYLTIKYSSFGQLQWTRRYDGAAHGDDKVSAMTVDHAGNVYVTGSSPGTGSATDFATLKYGADGTPLWGARYDDSLHASDSAIGIAIDPTGNVIVTGSTVGPNSGLDFRVVAYNPSGHMLWTSTYDGPAHGDDVPTGLVIDNSGAAYITGSSSLSEGTEAATIKWSPGGERQWESRYHAAAETPHEHPVGVSVEARGDLFLASASIVQQGEVWSTVRYAQSTNLAVNPTGRHTPVTFALDQNYPNPFNPSTRIRYTVGGSGRTTLKIFDLLGRHVATLVDRDERPGTYTVRWDASGFASGVYFCRMRAGGFSDTRQLLLLR